MWGLFQSQHHHRQLGQAVASGCVHKTYFCKRKHFLDYIFNSCLINARPFKNKYESITF